MYYPYRNRKYFPEEKSFKLHRWHSTFPSPNPNPLVPVPSGYSPNKPVHKALYVWQINAAGFLILPRFLSLLLQQRPAGFQHPCKRRLRSEKIVIGYRVSKILPHQYLPSIKFRPFSATQYPRVRLPPGRCQK